VADGVVEVSVGSVTQTGRVYGGAYRITGVPAGLAQIVGIAFADHYQQSALETSVQVEPGQSVELNLVAPGERTTPADTR
jgi:hypothetical protein